MKSFLSRVTISRGNEIHKQQNLFIIYIYKLYILNIRGHKKSQGMTFRENSRSDHSTKQSKKDKVGYFTFLDLGV